jgi:hypothetical protein
METIRAAGILVGAERSKPPERYEPPSLVPMGNLHDLLAGNGGTHHDCLTESNTTGNGTPDGMPGCNF